MHLIFFFPCIHSGDDVPEAWKGGLDIDYKIGNFSGPNITIQVNAKLQRRNITNIVGTIAGKEEPDRWVLVGSHRDSWAFGAVDSSSGTAVIMELARGLKKLINSGRYFQLDVMHIALMDNCMRLGSLKESDPPPTQARAWN